MILQVREVAQELDHAVQAPHIYSALQPEQYVNATSSTAHAGTLNPLFDSSIFNAIPERLPQGDSFPVTSPFTSTFFSENSATALPQPIPPPMPAPPAHAEVGLANIAAASGVNLLSRASHVVGFTKKKHPCKFPGCNFTTRHESYLKDHGAKLDDNSIRQKTCEHFGDKGFA